MVFSKYDCNATESDCISSKNEVWNIENGNSTLVEPRLLEHSFYPALFNVETDFCKIN